MSVHKPTRRTPTGIRQRHGRACKAKSRCSCPVEAFVWDKREGRKISKTFPTLAAAKAWRTDALGEAKRGELRQPTTTTLKQAADAFLAGARAGLIRANNGEPYKAATIRAYDDALRRRVLPALAHMRLSDVRRADVKALAKRLTGEGLSAATVANSIDPLRVLYRQALDDEVVAHDPTERLGLSRRGVPRDRVAEPAEAVVLLNALGDDGSADLCDGDVCRIAAWGATGTSRERR